MIFDTNQSSIYEPSSLYEEEPTADLGIKDDTQPETTISYLEIKPLPERIKGGQIIHTVGLYDDQKLPEHDGSVGYEQLKKEINDNNWP